MLQKKEIIIGINLSDATSEVDNKENNNPKVKSNKNVVRIVLSKFLHQLK